MFQNVGEDLVYITPFFPQKNIDPHPDFLSCSQCITASMMEVYYNCAKKLLSQKNHKSDFFCRNEDDFKKLLLIDNKLLSSVKILRSKFTSLIQYFN